MTISPPPTTDELALTCAICYLSDFCRARHLVADPDGEACEFFLKIARRVTDAGWHK